MENSTRLFDIMKSAVSFEIFRQRGELALIRASNSHSCLFLYQLLEDRM